MMIGASMAVRPPRSRGPVLMMIDALRRIGGSLWMVDNAYTGAFVDNAGTTPVTAVGDLIGKVLDKTGTNHATQSAVASKPSFQRVPKRLGPNLVTAGDGSSLTPWAGSVGYTVTAGAFKGNGSTAAPILKQVVGAQQGKTYRVTFTQAGRTSGYSYLVLGGTQPVGIPNLIANKTYTFDLIPANASGELSFATPSGTFDGSFDDIAVQEVTEWANVISFDGNNDFLQTGITTGNEGWVCAGVTSNSYAVTKTIFWTGANGPSEAGATLRVLGGGVVQMVTCDGTAQAASSGGANAATGTPQVIEGGWNATTLRAAVDGAEATAPNTRGGASTQTAKIGDAASGQWFNGPMHAIAYAPVLPSAADRKIIRNGIAALQGRTL